LMGHAIVAGTGKEIVVRRRRVSTIVITEECV